jgi:predicted PolB exonuclease-like 3'-5' exonuclease
MANSNVSSIFHAFFNFIKKELGTVSTKPAKKFKIESKVYPIESQCRVLDSYGYCDFQDSPFLSNNIECNNFVSRFVELKRVLMNRNGGKKPSKGKAYNSLFFNFKSLYIIDNQ